MLRASCCLKNTEEVELSLERAGLLLHSCRRHPCCFILVCGVRSENMSAVMGNEWLLS